MIDKIVGIATGTDKKNQTFYKVRFQSGLEASTWNQDHFPHLITGNEVDITISETEQMGRFGTPVTYRNIISIIPVIQGSTPHALPSQQTTDASPKQVRPRVVNKTFHKSEHWMPEVVKQPGILSCNAMTNAIGFVDSMAKKYTWTEDQYNSRVMKYYDIFFKIHIRKMEEALLAYSMGNSDEGVEIMEEKTYGDVHNPIATTGKGSEIPVDTDGINILTTDTPREVKLNKDGIYEDVTPMDRVHPVPKLEGEVAVDDESLDDGMLKPTFKAEQ